jgi:hypothetical protein
MYVLFLTQTGLPVFHGSGIVIGLSLWGPRFDPRPVHMAFVFNREALDEVFLWALRFFPVSIVPSMLHAHSFIYYWCYVITAINKTVKWHLIQNACTFHSAVVMCVPAVLPSSSSALCPQDMICFLTGIDCLKISMLLTVFQIFLAWMTGAWQSNKVLPPSILVWRDVTVAKRTVICRWFWLSSWNQADSAQLRWSAHCWYVCRLRTVSIRGELQMDQYAHEYCHSLLAVPHIFKVLLGLLYHWRWWHYDLPTSGLTHLVKQCHILEDVCRQQCCCENLKYYIQEVITEICFDCVTLIELAQNHMKWMVYLCILWPESVTVQELNTDCLFTCSCALFM